MGSAASAPAARGRRAPAAVAPRPRDQEDRLAHRLRATERQLEKLQRALRTIEFRAAPPSSPVECVICMDAPVETVFVPCCHACACVRCAAILGAVGDGGVCPVCRGLVEGAPRIFLAATAAATRRDAAATAATAPSVKTLCATIG